MNREVWELLPFAIVYGVLIWALLVLVLTYA
jgi:hypothetical protein